MKKVEYPKGVLYEDSFKKVFAASIANMQTKWTNLLNKYPGDLGFLPPLIEDVLIARYDVLVRWYIAFMNLSVVKRKAMNGDLIKVFDYDAWREQITDYFTNPTNGYNFASCHYCDTAYINAYKVDPNDDGLYFLNVASDEELDKITKSIVRKNAVKAQRPYVNKTQFDNLVTLFRWSSNKWDRTFHPNKHYRQHFDLDHVLPKSECGFVALSLYNLVPSCPICNQRLKKARVLGVMGIPNVALSPTSAAFDFDGNAEFTMIPNPGVKVGRLRPSLHPQDYILRLHPHSPDYEYFIRLFKLDERYQQHKRVALHWVEMKTKYSDAKIQMMEKALNHRSFSFVRIKSDIFQDDLFRGGYLTFSKLRKDMLK